MFRMKAMTPDTIETFVLSMNIAAANEVQCRREGNHEPHRQRIIGSTDPRWDLHMVYSDMPRSAGPE